MKSFKEILEEKDIVLVEAGIDKVKNQFKQNEKVSTTAFRVLNIKYMEPERIKNPERDGEKILKDLGVKFKDEFTGKDQDGDYTWGFKDEFEIVAYFSNQFKTLYVAKGISTKESKKYTIDTKYPI